MLTHYQGQRPKPLTLFWKLVIGLAALVGVGTCVALGLLYSHFFIVQLGTMTVLEKPATERDVLDPNSITGAEAELASLALLPDQFEHKQLEADGWVTLHQNLMIQPLPPCRAPRTC